MSYILDALKRAEAERDADARVAFAAEERGRRRVHLALYGVAVALLANAVVLLWLFLPDTTSTPHTTGRPAVTAEPTNPGSGSDPARPTAEADAGQPAGSGVETEIPAPAASPAPPPQPAERTLRASPLRLRDLPEDARRRFPKLTFTTHIFAREPDLRAVVVNGQRLTEGSTLGGLLLEEITEDGAVFRFETYRVAIDVVSSWE